MTKTLFFSYSHKDEVLRDELEIHLAMLKREELIDAWHDRRIVVGNEFHGEIHQWLEQADVILFLVSPDFLASNYCYDVEVGRAMERHVVGDTQVIPIILRPCEWQSAPFGKLLATPTDGKPITKWADRDDAFLNVTRAIRKAVEQNPKVAVDPLPLKPVVQQVGQQSSVRSSNLRVTKQFSARDIDHFRGESFEYIANYFENSLTELNTRNADIESSFRRLDSSQFTAAIYRNGSKESTCTVSLRGDSFRSDAITYSHDEFSDGNSYNDGLAIDHDDVAMYLKPLLWSAMYGGQGEMKLTMEGGAEHFWAKFMEPLQRSQK